MSNKTLSKLKVSILFLLVFCLKIHAQQSVNCAGGNANSSFGSVSYSVGQMAYTLQTGNNNTITEGVQQPFEISVVTSFPVAQNLELSAYPNPSSNLLTLSLGTMEARQLSYKLFDHKGALILSQNINAISTSIDLQSLPKASYMLQVISEQNTIKTFQIIKN